MIRHDYEMPEIEFAAINILNTPEYRNASELQQLLHRIQITVDCMEIFRKRHVAFNAQESLISSLEGLCNVFKTNSDKILQK
jgi:hypothetical protein